MRAGSFKNLSNSSGTETQISKSGLIDHKDPQILPPLENTIDVTIDPKNSDHYNLYPSYTKVAKGTFSIARNLTFIYLLYE